MRFVKWLIGLMIVVGVFLALAPYAARWYMIHWFESRHYQAQIKHVGLDFIFGEVTLYGVDIRNAEGEGIRVLDAHFDFDWLPLLKGHLLINKATIDSAHLDFRKSEDDWLVAGFSSGEWGSEWSSNHSLQVRALSLANTELCKDYQAQCLRIESAVVTRARLSRHVSGWSLAHDGPLSVQKAFLRDRSSDTTLFYGGELSVDRGSYAPQAVNMTFTRLQNIQFIENEIGEGAADAPYQTQIGELTLASVLWQRNGNAVKFELGPIDATSVRQSVQKNKDGQLLLPERVQGWLKSLGHSVMGEDVHFRLAQLTARDGAVAWLDHSVSPLVSEKLTALQLAVGVIDSQLANSPTSFKLSGKIGRKGLLRFEGEWFPYAQASQFSLNGLIESLNLATLAGYTEELFNQRINQGSIDVAVDAVAKNGRLNATTRWQWTDFDIEPAREKSPYMPLERAYGVLKDHNDSLRFSLDISGEMGSETVRPTYILATQARRTLSNMARGRADP